MKRYYKAFRRLLQVYAIRDAGAEKQLYFVARSITPLHLMATVVATVGLGLISRIWGLYTFAERRWLLSVYRYSVPEGTACDGNQKLASLADDTQDTGRSVAIETRTEGGYFVIAPSLHPSGNRYELLCGSWDNIPTISYAHRNALLEAARRLDEMPHTRQELEGQREQTAQPKATTYRVNLNGDASVIDVYNAKTLIADELLYTTIHRTPILPNTSPSVRQAIRWIAQLGGFLGLWRW